jgi:hypothetical protein
MRSGVQFPQLVIDPYPVLKPVVAILINTGYLIWVVAVPEQVCAVCLKLVRQIQPGLGTGIGMGILILTWGLAETMGMALEIYVEMALDQAVIISVTVL